MSEASAPFAIDLLNQLGIGLVREEACMEAGGQENPDPFNWMMALANGKEIERSETEATPDFRGWLQEAWLGNDSSLSIELVTGESLPKIMVPGKSATGKSDLCVGSKEEMQTLSQAQTDRLPAASGIVETKRQSAKLNIPQMQLELFALARMSRFKKGVVLLGTDGVQKWCLVRFSKYNEIALQFFRSGRRCLEECESLLSGIDAQTEAIVNAQTEELSNKKARLSSIQEEGAVFHGTAQRSKMEGEQDLSGFEDGENDQRDEAIKDENFLRRLAEALGDLAGGNDHRPELPEWALAKNRIPSYYS